MKKQQPEQRLKTSVLIHDETDLNASQHASQDLTAVTQAIFESEIYSCPHCQSRHFVGVGKHKGIQRFRCKSCLKYFSETTGKFMYCLKKRELLKQYLECFMEGCSIRKSAKICGISKQTSFTWRHKILIALQGISSVEFDRIVEVAGVEEPFSTKGQRNKKEEVRAETTKMNTEEEAVKLNDNKKPIAPITEDPKMVSILHARDWRGNLTMKVISKGKMKKGDLERVLSNKLDKVEVLCSQANRSVTVFVRRKELELVRSKRRGRRARKSERGYQTNNVLRSILDWRNFVEPFYGVATKYLQNYLNWFMIFNRLKEYKNQIKQIIDILLKENRAWYQFKAGFFNMDIST